MRYRITFVNESIDHPPIEIEGGDLRIVGRKRIRVGPMNTENWTPQSNPGAQIDILFAIPIHRISDDHDREIYRA